MRVALLDWNGKAARIGEVLKAAGVHVTPWPDTTADVALFDTDSPVTKRDVFIGEARKAKTAVWLYPHGGGAYMPAIYDGIYEADRRVAGMLVHGPGQVAVAKKSQCPHRAVDIGWTLSDVVRRCEPWDGVAPLKVLFGPIHPPYAWEEHPKINQLLWRELTSQLPSNVELGIRHVGSLEANGLNYVEDATYHRSDTFADLDTQAAVIDGYDVVVAADSGTFATFAAARGKALVIYDSQRVGGDHNRSSYNDNPTHWGAYRDYIAHPFDYAKAKLWKLIERSSRDVKHNQGWADKFVGADLSAEKIIAAITEVANHGEHSAA